jgi:hypothetical protein
MFSFSYILCIVPLFCYGVTCINSKNSKRAGQILGKFIWSTKQQCVYLYTESMKETSIIVRLYRHFHTFTSGISEEIFTPTNNNIDYNTEDTKSDSNPVPYNTDTHLGSVPERTSS